MKRNLAMLFALIAWFAVVSQFVLMMENRVESVPETIIRFFSFFTILTNTLVALYFSGISFVKRGWGQFVHKPGTLTAITVYITVVGAVYQIALRHIWDPQGLQKVVDELLHSVIPVLTILFWYLYEQGRSVKYAQILKWAIYPLAYLIYILVRGSFSDFYPYPFVNVTEIGLSKVLTNVGVLILAFTGLSAAFLFIGRSIKR